MKFRIFVYFCIFIFSNIDLYGQRKLSCGLITNFDLISNSICKKPTQNDIALLNKINSDVNIQTYLSKVVFENSKEILISLYTSATLEDLLREINFKKVDFKIKKIIKKNNCSFYCFYFHDMNKKINRIIFNEPDLTLCIVIDIVTSETINNDTYFDEITQRLTFKK